MNDRQRKIIDEYKTRMELSERQFMPYKQKISYARKAYRQIAPDDILNTIISTTDNGNSGYQPENRLPKNNNSSRMIYPLYSAICNKMIETLHGLPPRYEWAANTNNGIATAWALELELMKCYTKSNIGAKIPLLIWHLVVDGIFAQQTVYKQMSEKLFIPGADEPEIIYNGGTIDFEIYDPLTCFFDWDADITDIRKTSKFFIVTIANDLTRDGLIDRFGKEKVEKAEKEGLGTLKAGKTGDVLKGEMERQNGYVEPIESYVYREYYTNDGMCYKIINDWYIIEEGHSPSGCADQIPVNIGVAYFDPDTKLGTTLWDRVKWGVAMMSQAVNQVADRNAFNNKAPFFTSADIDITDDFTQDASMGRRIYKINPTMPNQTNVNEMITQLMLPEVLPGAEFMFNAGQQSLFYVTGTNSMAFGIQDKQIRTSDVANMIGQSLVRSDSDIAKKIECSFFNPVTWDFLRIFYVHYKDFPTFAQNNIPPDFLKNYKDIRVVNGSYLTADKAERLGKLQQVLRLAIANPNGMRLINLYHDLIQAIGFINPSIYLKSEGEITLETLLYGLVEAASSGAIDEETMQQAQAAIDFLMKATQTVAIQGGTNAAS